MIKREYFKNISTQELLMDYYTHNASVKRWDIIINAFYMHEIPEQVFNEFFEVAQFWLFDGKQIINICNNKVVTL